MILMLLGHPIAFVVGLLVAVGLIWGYESATDRVAGNYLGLGVIVLCYLLAYRLLPWWTHPYALWRHWRWKRSQKQAHKQIASLDAAILADRTPTAPTAYIPRMAFDAETQRANGMPMYHTHYISPEMQRYLEEFFVDDEGLPSLKAGVYVTPIRVTGPELLDAPPPQRPFYIPHDQLIRVQQQSTDAPPRPPGWAPSFCRFCGAPLDAGDRYCAGCGEQLGLRPFS